jgi:hypothetical protein
MPLICLGRSEIENDAFERSRFLSPNGMTLKSVNRSSELLKFVGVDHTREIIAHRTIARECNRGFRVDLVMMASTVRSVYVTQSLPLCLAHDRSGVRMLE